MVESFAESMQQSEPSPERDRKAIVLLLRQLQAVEREQADQAAWFYAVRVIAEEEEDARYRTMDSLTAAIEELAKELRSEGSQHVDIPGLARIQFKTTAEYLRVADPAALVAWALEHEESGIIEDVPASHKPLTAAAKTLAESTFKETGYVLPWAEYVPEVTAMKIEDRGARHG